MPHHNLKAVRLALVLTISGFTRPNLLIRGRAGEVLHITLIALHRLPACCWVSTATAAMYVRRLPPALLLVLPTIHALTLSDFQPINGFSAQCTQSYNTPLQGCTQSDFQSDHSCSANCITFLEALTKMLNTDCKGISAFPNTLIGLFFSQQGTSTLCPNVLGTSGSGGGDQASYAPGASPGGASTSQTTEQQASAETASTTMFPATSSHVTLALPLSSSSASSFSPSSGAATSSTVIIAQTTVTPLNPPPTKGPIAAAPSSTSLQSNSSTSSTSQASSTSKSSDGRGGTILDVGSTAAARPSLQLKTCAWVLLGGSALLALLF